MCGFNYITFGKEASPEKLIVFLHGYNSSIDDVAPYAKILAFNENGQKILNRIKKTSEIPIIKNMTALKKSGNSELRDQYEREAALDRLFDIYTEEK